MLQRFVIRTSKAHQSSRFSFLLLYNVHLWYKLAQSKIRCVNRKQNIKCGQDAFDLSWYIRAYCTLFFTAEGTRKQNTENIINFKSVITPYNPWGYVKSTFRNVNIRVLCDLSLKEQMALRVHKIVKNQTVYASYTGRGLISVNKIWYQQSLW